MFKALAKISISFSHAGDRSQDEKFKDGKLDKQSRHTMLKVCPFRARESPKLNFFVHAEYRGAVANLCNVKERSFAHNDGRTQLSSVPSHNS